MPFVYLDVHLEPTAFCHLLSIHVVMDIYNAVYILRLPLVCNLGVYNALHLMQYDIYGHGAPRSE